MAIQKKNITDLIRAYSENNDRAFRDEAYKIACIFSEGGDDITSEYIISLLSKDASLFPQVDKFIPETFEILSGASDPLFLPDTVSRDLIAVSRLISTEQYNLNKFIFIGSPGTGKTEAVGQLGRIVNREVLSIDFSQLVDSRLGQTPKNIFKLFEDIKMIPNPEKIIIIFDEIDSIALDRINEHDHREMGRATTAFLKGIDEIDRDVVIIATTNLGRQLDKALLRRFDMIIDFDRYTDDDLVEVAVGVLCSELKKQHKRIDNFQKIAKKFFKYLSKLPNPGELKNAIRVSVALCDASCPSSLFTEMARRISPLADLTEGKLKTAGFSIREIEQITGVSRSSISRKIREASNA